MDPVLSNIFLIIANIFANLTLLVIFLRGENEHRSFLIGLTVFVIILNVVNLAIQIWH